MSSPPSFWGVLGDFGPTVVVLEALAVAAVLLAHDAWKRWRKR